MTPDHLDRAGLPEQEQAPEEPATGAGEPARDRRPSRVDEALVPEETPGETEPDTTDMDATGDGGQVFGG